MGVQVTIVTKSGATGATEDYQDAEMTHIPTTKGSGLWCTSFLRFGMQSEFGKVILVDTWHFECASTAILFAACLLLQQ